MNDPGSRIARFVRAARSLLLMQVAAALVATALGIWAVLAVQDLAAERDQLRARVADLEAGRPAAVPTDATPRAAAPSPLEQEVRPPVILPVPIPVTELPTDVLPKGDEPVPPPIDPEPRAADPPPATVTPPRRDCTGANASLPRCRSNRWRQRPITPAMPAPQQPPTNERPEPR